MPAAVGLVCAFHDSGIFVSECYDKAFHGTRMARSCWPHVRLNDLQRFVIVLTENFLRHGDRINGMLLTAFEIAVIFLISSENAQVVAERSLYDGLQIHHDMKSG